MKFVSALKAKLIYVYRINDPAHMGCLKVGEATIETSDISCLSANSKPLNDAAKQRINQQTQTAGIAYQLLYTEPLVYISNGHFEAVNDGAVHDVLISSGIKRKLFNIEKKANEWFITDLETVKKAITAAKSGRKSLKPNEISKGRSPIVFRPEQQEAIDKTKKRYKSGNKRMLWYAKMRFGKTLSALQVVKDLGFQRTIIITHRPVVDKGWFEDFEKIFYDTPVFSYGSKNKGESFDNLEKAAKRGEKYVYFASMQDLRGSEGVGGKFEKNDAIFAAKWDFVIIDEAHEGTQTELGKSVLDTVVKQDTKVLHLSGTPFNLLDDFSDSETFTWDYVMEQRAKANWDLVHCGDPNPYACLPRLNIYTYDLGKLYSAYKDDGGAFNFREFFRTNIDSGEFIHKKDVWSFLNLICKADSESNYPYSTKEYRDNFRHSLWMIPGVKEAKALSKMLKEHPVFGLFDIVNVAGDGDEETNYNDALKAVEDAIGNDPDKTYTITLSCGKLTTGVSVKAWTAVMMLAGSYSTSAAGYMQTIFRVQTPATINGRVKEECFVFDFAPDRTLKVVAETAKFSVKGGKSNSESDRQTMGEFLNFCPIIAIDGSQMKKYNVPHLLEQLKRVYIERVVSRGFEDVYLYNNDELMQLSDIDLLAFDHLKKIIGSTKASHATGEIDLNNQGFNKEEHEQLEQAEKKKKAKQPLTEEEKRLLEEKAEKNKARLAAISILRGISIRMPLLIYGADITDEAKELTIDNFTSLVDDLSWVEFMPANVSKADFENFKKYYDPEVFAASGRRIREMVKAADGKPIEERIERLAAVFGAFRNPDKETVLTPWRVVNLHLSDMLGGWDFFDENHIHHSSDPRFVYKGEVTDRVFNPQSKVLEINSKSGLYPLYMTYSIYQSRCAAAQRHNQQLDDKTRQQLWDETVANNIFVVCKTPMAKSITRRTLLGFREGRVNTRYFDDLINQITNRQDNFLYKITNGWKGYSTMKFNVIVGNPPYQFMDGGAGASSVPIYNKFVEIAKKAEPQFISMIMPSRWMTGGRGLDSFRSEMIADKCIIKLYDYVNANYCFTNVEIKGGVCYFLRDANNPGECEIHSFSDDNREVVSHRYLSDDNGIFIRDGRLISILNKVRDRDETSFSSLVSEMKPYGLRGDFFQDPTKYGLPVVSETKPNGEYYTIIGLDEKQHRVKRYIPKSYPIPKKTGLDMFKIFVPRNFGAGKMGDTPYNEILATPGQLCTETFVQILPFKNQNEMENCRAYMRTNFFRLLLSIKKNDQGAGRGVYELIPIQDFSILWTDQMLYDKYGFDESERGLINSLIKPMR